MNTFEAIYSRKSVRSYTGEPVAETELNEILKAAYAAPVGRARYDSLHLTVITDKDYLSRWDRATAVSFGDPDIHPLYGAPTVILVSSTLAGEPEADNVSYSNAAIIVQNMAIAATELGVGSCHIWGAVRTLNVSPDLLAELALPEGMVPCCALIVGKTDEKYELREIGERIETSCK